MTIFSQKITKAEVLITRRCNLRCQSCGMIKDTVREMQPDEWALAWDTIYTKLGASFVAIYGGEPSCYGKDRLVRVIRDLAKHRGPSTDFTIISNGVGLAIPTLQSYIDAGLESWTSSVDDFPASAKVAPEDMVAKSHTGYRALTMAKEMGIRDTCGIVTLHARNLDTVIPTINRLCGEGHWVGLDVLHYQRGDGEYTFSAKPEDMPGLMLNESHLPQLRKIAEKLIKRHEKLLVFPTKKVLEGLMDPAKVLDLSWKCTPGHSITIDADGTIGLCDDRMPTRMGEARKELLAPLSAPWNISDLRNVDVVPGLWEAFLQWYDRDLKTCQGCWWSTHAMAVDAIDSPELREHYVHKRTPGEL